MQNSTMQDTVFANGTIAKEYYAGTPCTKNKTSIVAFVNGFEWQ